MSWETVDVERNGQVATVRLDRPDRFNALDETLIGELDSALDELGRDGSVRAVVVTGNGPAFCAGGDLRAAREEMSGDLEASFRRLAGDFHDVIRTLREMPKGVVAAIGGPAVGGGFSLSLACDLRIMADEAYLKVGYLGSGLSMDGGGSFHLPRMVGLSRAMELAALDEKIGPERAASLGLVSRVVEVDDFRARVGEFANRVAELPRAALARTKELFNRSENRTLDEQLEEERRHIAEAAATPEGREGIEAFVDKREPDFPSADPGTD